MQLGLKNSAHIFLLVNLSLWLSFNPSFIISVCTSVLSLPLKVVILLYIYFQPRDISRDWKQPPDDVLLMLYCSGTGQDVGLTRELGSSLMWPRVFQKWHFVKKKILQYQYAPLRGVYKPDPKAFFCRTSLEGQTT